MEVLKYRAEIDGLRAFAVIPVILFHAGFDLFSGGYVGVDVFFVISGYLITSIILTEMREGRFSLAGFYERRARRILPALYAVTLITGLISCFILMPDELVSMAKSMASIPVFLSNFFFWSERGYFGTGIDLKPLVHTWSLAVEEQFYIFFPIALILLGRNVQKYIKILIIFVFLVSLTISWYVSRVHFETAFYLPFSRVWELAVGASVAVLLLKNVGPPKHWQGSLLTTAGLLAIAYSYISFDDQTIFPSLNALFPTVGTALVIVGTANETWIRRILSYRPLVWVGLISYSLYLVHQPVFVFARNLGYFDLYRTYLIALSVLLAWASYVWVEKPFRTREHFSRRFIFRFAAAGGAAVILFAGAIIAADGFPERYAAADRKILLQYRNLPGYNQRLFDSREGAELDAGKKKVILIGDSHAKDFINILEESKLFGEYSFSTKQINSECGNLYLDDYTPLYRHIPDKRQERCRVMGWYEGAKFRELTQSADEIWLVNAWHAWTVPYLHESIKRIEEGFGVTVRVFGLKNFGTVSKEKVLKIEQSERVGYGQPVLPEALAVDRAMTQALDSFPRYYPVLDMMCGGDAGDCRIFDGEGAIISPDGGHLTQEGAKEVAKRLMPVFHKILRSAAGET